MTDNQSNRVDWIAVIFAIALPTVVTLIYFVLLAKAPAALQQVAYGIGKTIQFGFPAVFIWLFHRNRFARTKESTIPAERIRQSWIVGIAFGILVVVSMLVAWFVFLAGSETATSLTQKVNEKVSGMNLDSPLKFLAMGAFYAIVHSFLEEYYWRWFVFDQLDKLTTTLNANLISSLGFAAHHVILLATFFGWSSPLTWLFSLGVAFGGAIWAWLYHRGGRLSVPWISHLIVDAGIFGLGYLIVFGAK